MMRETVPGFSQKDPPQVATMQARQVQGRERLNMDSNWLFHLGEMPGSLHSQQVLGWRWKSIGEEIPQGREITLPDLSAEDEAWREAAPGQDVFDLKPGFAWFKAILPDVQGPHRFLHFESVDDNATVYVNGRKLFYHEGWNDCFDVPVDSVWKPEGHNQVLVLVENLPGGIFPGGFIKRVDLCSTTLEMLKPVSPRFDDSSWKPVQVPHDFVIEGDYDPREEVYHGFLPRNTAWYRKSFFIPESDKGRSLWLDFDGIYRNSQIWLNGRLLGSHLSGYTGFHYEITDSVVYGAENILAVHVDARSGEGWWYEGGGIYRHVWLNKTDFLHIAPLGTHIISTPVGREDAPSTAEIEIRTTLANQSNLDCSCKLHLEVQDAAGKVVLVLSGDYSIRGGGKEVVTQKGNVPDPILWSLENPHLYRLKSRIEKDGQIVDETENTFGVRSFRFDKNLGFFLNGKPTRIKGTCNHQDFAGIGIALPDRIFTYRLEKLKEMGSNAYRCSHNPPAVELLNECDRLGMLVVDEHRKLGDSKEILSQLESMVLRDRNHPSIILWSLCNEEPKQGTEEGRRMGESMKKAVLKHDQTRPITCAMNGGWGSGLTNVIDIQGFNYNISQYDPFHKNHPHMPMYGSETASTVSTRGIYENDPAKGYVSAYDVNHPEWALPAEKAWQPIVENAFIAGCFVWTGFDYKGEPTPYSWPCINSHFGILDICGFPKDNYYYYQSWWSNRTVLHLFPHWNWPGKEGREIDVWCHSNCEKVELFLNGKSHGVQMMPRNGHLEWKVKYAPGILKAIGYKKGVMIEAMVETTGIPSRIELKAYQAEMTADGEDIIPVTVAILDGQGRFVPTAENKVSFRIAGPGLIAGVGNGDPSSHERDKASERKAFNGLCMVMIQAGHEPGRIKLTAESDGLTTTEVELRSLKKVEN